MLGWDGGERTKEMMRKGKEKKENDWRANLCPIKNLFGLVPPSVIDSQSFYSWSWKSIFTVGGWIKARFQKARSGGNSPFLFPAFPNFTKTRN
jgi:hypothetical protein